MKNLIYTLLIFFALQSCKTKSVIITSKKVAISKNVYQKKEPTFDEIVKRQITKEKTKVVENIEVDEADFEKNNPPIPYRYIRKPSLNNTLAEQIINYGLDNIGSRYQTGGITKSGFDCSGLMLSIFGEFGIKLPRTSNDMSRFGTEFTKNQAKKGDLIFFKTLGNTQINHVGMVIEIEDGEIWFLHASISRGVIVSSTSEAYYHKTFAQINRVLK